VVEQRTLDVEAAAEAGQGAVGADEAVAGQDDRQRVAAVRRADGAGRPRRAEHAGLLAVAAGRRVRDLRERQPRAPLEVRRRREVEREVEGRALAREPGAQLAGRRREDGVVRRRLDRNRGRRLAGPAHLAEPDVGRDERELADRGRDAREPHAPAAQR